MRQVLEYLEDTLVSGPQLQNVRLLKVGTTCCKMMVHRNSLNHPSMCSCLISSAARAVDLHIEMRMRCEKSLPIYCVYGLTISLNYPSPR